MSRAIMHAQIEAEQHAAEAAFERLPIEQQQAILAREAAFIAPPKPRRKKIKCFTLERGPRAGKFNLTVTHERRIRCYEINSRRYNQLVHLANCGNYHVEIYDADFGVAWMIRRHL